MSSYQFVNPSIGVRGVSATGTDQKHDLGFIAEARDGSLGYAEFMYVRGASASTPTAGDWCQVTNGSAGQVVSGGTASQGRVGVAPAALSGTNVFGWVQIYGICDYAKLATAGAGAVGVPVMIGTTAGRAQTTASATGFRIEGAFINSYPATSKSDSGTVDLYYPTFSGR